jgi:hypothetical protein
MSSKGKLRLVPKEQVLSTPQHTCSTLAITSQYYNEFQMQKKDKQGNTAKDGANTYSKGGLWIAPSFSFKQITRQSDWKLPLVEPNESNKFLKLADVALGLSATEKRKKKRTL